VTADDVAAFERCVTRGGVALFPADTVYGLAVDPSSRAAVERLYALKARPAAQPAAVMFFALEQLLDALPDLPPHVRAAAARLLPGPVTLVVPNARRRYPLACGPAPERLGVRVPSLMGELSPLAAMQAPVLQSSANVSGGREARRLADVDRVIRSGADLELDGGELPGVPSTVVDVSSAAEARVLREGALPAAAVREALDA
jgi:L-threonylcarbamoyladenylate synthase